MHLSRAATIPPDIISSFSAPEQAAAISRVEAAGIVGMNDLGSYDGKLEVVGVDEVDGSGEGFHNCVGEDETVGETDGWRNVIVTFSVGAGDGLDDGVIDAVGSYDGKVEVVGVDEVDGSGEGFHDCVGEDETVGETDGW